MGPKLNSTLLQIALKHYLQDLHFKTIKVQLGKEHPLYLSKGQTKIVDVEKNGEVTLYHTSDI